MSNHDNGELAKRPGDPTVKRKFVRSALASPSAWMIEVGAGSEGRSSVSSSGEHTTAAPNERSACRAAVDADRDRIAQRLNDDIIRELFGVGLRLQATAQLANDTVQGRLQVAILDLDLIIAEVRNVIFDRKARLHQSFDDSTSNSQPDGTSIIDELATSGEHAGVVAISEGTAT